MSEVLDFDKQNGLITAVVQDAKTHRVLMVGYMNREAFDKTVATGHVTFFSRSRQKLWIKGESSGHYLMLKSIATDCDGDALLVEASHSAPASATKATKAASSALSTTATGASPTRKCMTPTRSMEPRSGSSS